MSKLLAGDPNYLQAVRIISSKFTMLSTSSYH